MNHLHRLKMMHLLKHEDGSDKAPQLLLRQLMPRLRKRPYFRKFFEDHKDESITTPEELEVFMQKFYACCTEQSVCIE